MPVIFLIGFVTIPTIMNIAADNRTIVIIYIIVINFVSSLVFDMNSSLGIAETTFHPVSPTRTVFPMYSLSL
ncbi:hypothetical protein SDC9_59091 [bioreactor metagenome]|uniref:Uncharacterized protein n=1 Tax=bioreactor metagenome TaxID=1076179 RepID=A0A644XA00_9ZZZZ